jgi:LysR family transcriptional regulator, glycine cleavage system transcriptional activator
LGLAIGPYPLVQREMKNGTLIAPFGFIKGNAGYLLLSRRPFDQQQRSVALVSWLREEASSSSRPPRSQRAVGF